MMDKKSSGSMPPVKPEESNPSRTSSQDQIDNFLNRGQISSSNDIAAFLGKVGGIEQMVFMKLDGEIIKAVPEEDVDRTSAEGKASSVQFIHFKFNDEQIKKFKSSSSIEVGINHNEYSH